MNRRIPMRQRQRGTTLLIALVFLVILTLFAVSGMNTGVINLRTANNAQLMLEAEYAAQQQIEAVLNSVTGFMTVASAATVSNIDVNGDSVTDFVVTTQAPVCLSIQPAPGYSYEFAASAPKDTVWQVTAVAADSVFGSTATLRQGVKIRLPVNAICVNP
jgi:Tfp pilus assembly protein PilX